MNFLSDNAVGAHPQIIEALGHCADVTQHGYGDEEITRTLEKDMGAVFETDVRVFPVITGTAANALVLAALCPPHSAIFCHREAHLDTDECGAPEFFTGGAKLHTIDTDDGKLTPSALSAAWSRYHDMVHMVVPKAVSITQSTETGQVYGVDDVAAIGQWCKAHGLFLHMDGARFANAVVSTGQSAAELTWRAGVDVLSFGATKNGAFAAEAVVFFNPDLVGDFEFRRKRSGHLLSKQYMISAQLRAYLKGGLWLKLAKHANAHALQIAESAAGRLRYACEANEVFITLSQSEKEQLRSQGFAFYDWGAQDDDLARFVTSWATKSQDTDALCRAISAMLKSQ